MDKPITQWTLPEMCQWYMQTNYSNDIHIRTVLENVEDAIWINIFFKIGNHHDIYDKFVSWAHDKLQIKGD